MKKLFLFFIAVSFLSGCSTIMRDNNQNIPIYANVEKVNFKIKNRSGRTVMEGVTPYTVNLKTSVDGGYFSPEKYTIAASTEG